MICAYCGTEIADKALICFRCGASVQDTVHKPYVARRKKRPLIVYVIFVLIVLIAIALALSGRFFVFNF
jgi:predicted amidophosphoribosyltransferase